MENNTSKARFERSCSDFRKTNGIIAQFLETLGRGRRYRGTPFLLGTRPHLEVERLAATVALWMANEPFKFRLEFVRALPALVGARAEPHLLPVLRGGLERTVQHHGAQWREAEMYAKFRIFCLAILAKFRIFAGHF